MIKIEDFCKAIYVKGYPEQIAMEFEDLARAVRVGLCEGLGKEVGSAFYKEILARAEMSAAESRRLAGMEAEHLEKERTEIFELFMNLPSVKTMEQALQGGKDHG